MDDKMCPPSYYILNGALFMKLVKGNLEESRKKTFDIENA